MNDIANIRLMVIEIGLVDSTLKLTCEILLNFVLFRYVKASNLRLKSPRLSERFSRKKKCQPWIIEGWRDRTGRKKDHGNKRRVEVGY